MYEEEVPKCEDASREEMRVCRGCLEAASELSDLRDKRLDQTFIDLTGLSLSTYNIPPLACAMCLQLLRKFSRFRACCHSASYALQQIHYQNQTINSNNLNTIDTKHLKYNLIKRETEVLSFEPTKSKSKRNIKPKFKQTETLHIDIQPQDEVYIDIKDNTEMKQEPIDNDDLEFVITGDYSTDKSPTLKFEEETNTPITIISNLNVTESSTKPVINSDTDKSDIDDDDYKPNLSDSCGIHDDSDDDDNFTLSDVIKKGKANVKSKKGNKKSTKVKRKSKAVESEGGNKVRRRKELKERSEDKKLIKEIGETFKKMWRWKTEEKMDIFRMFEKIYEESKLVKNGDSGACDHKHSKGMVCVKQELRIFLGYVKKLAELYNIDVEFLSVAGQKREIEERRRSVEYQQAQYRCQLCGKIFNFPDTYKRHMASHEVHPGDVECEICRYRFKRHASLMSHIHTMHSKKLKCRECGFVNRTWNLAKEHYNFHQGIAPVCHLCGKNFTEKKHYLMHLRQVHRAQVATTLCLLCGDSFNGPTGLRIHMDRSHRQAAKCAQCGSWFLNKEMLAAHAQADGAGCEPGHSACPQCGCNFSSEELMWRHHDEQHIKEYKCEECNKSYAGLRKYKWHIENKHVKGRRAPGDKPRKRPQDYKGNKNFVCDICGKDDFPFLSSLRFHQRKHTDEKPHACSVCNKTFKEKLNLKVHMTIHTDERRYQCPYCPKAFRQFSHRTVHIRTHTKEKPYSCEICQKQFSHRSVMLEHTRTVHEGMPPRRRHRHDKQHPI